MLMPTLQGSCIVSSQTVARLRSQRRVVLPAVVRDFQPYGSTNLNGLDAHPDFNNCSASETGIVATTLGADSKPVYAKTSEILPPSSDLSCSAVTHTQHTAVVLICAPCCCRLEHHRVVRQWDHTRADVLQPVVSPGTSTSGSELMAVEMATGPCMFAAGSSEQACWWPCGRLCQLLCTISPAKCSGRVPPLADAELTEVPLPPMKPVHRPAQQSCVK